MEIFTAVLNMVPNLVADLSPKDRADITKLVIIVSGTVSIAKYVSDRYFDSLEEHPTSAQGNSVPTLDTSATLLLDQPAAA